MKKEKIYNLSEEIPGFRPHDFPSRIPITERQIGWVEPIYKTAVCCFCGNKLKYSKNSGNCWTRVLGTNQIACTNTCATKQFYKNRGQDALTEILSDLLLLSVKPTNQSVLAFSKSMIT
jgi:hypothetical protein